MQLSAGFTELKNAFKGHCRDLKDYSTASYKLLLFYAVECGLKSIYLKRFNLKQTSDITDRYLTMDHDLKKLVKGLKLPAEINATNTAFKLERDNNVRQIESAHQAWRYGIKIKDEDEQRIVNWLNDIKKWLDERF